MNFQRKVEWSMEILLLLLLLLFLAVYFTLTLKWLVQQWKANFLNQNQSTSTYETNWNYDTKNTIPVIIFWNFATFLYSFHSPQAKQNLISSIKNFKQELFHKLPNYLRLGILGISPVPSLPFRNKT